MFAIKDKVVYPGHGVAIINRIIEKEFRGQKTCFYELSFLNKEATVLVPTLSTDDVGIRALSTREAIDDALKTLTEPAKRLPSTEFVSTNWSKRNKDYQLKLRSGSLKGLSEIYRDLRFVSKHKELSFGEKSLLNQAEMLLVEEISIVRQMAIEQTIRDLRELIQIPK